MTEVFYLLFGFLSGFVTALLVIFVNMLMGMIKLTKDFRSSNNDISHNNRSDDNNDDDLYKRNL